MGRTSHILFGGSDNSGQMCQLRLPAFGLPSAALQCSWLKRLFGVCAAGRASAHGTAKTRTNTIMAYRAKSPLAAVCVAITRTTAGALTWS